MNRRSAHYANGGRGAVNPSFCCTLSLSVNYPSRQYRSSGSDSDCGVGAGIQYRSVTVSLRDGLPVCGGVGGE